MAAWKNDDTAVEELSMVQGCVPLKDGQPVGVQDRPRAQEIVEETEEEFFINDVGIGEFEAPDLGLIKQMLDMVRGYEVSSCLERADGNVGISKLNPLSDEFVPSYSKLTDEKVDQVQALSRKEENGYADDVVLTCETISEIIEPHHKIVTKNRKRRNCRNVAVTSILELITANNPAQIIPEKENIETNCLPVKLLKPTDFVLTNNLPESTETVNKCVEVQEKDNKMKKAQPVLMLNPMSMFKKKTVCNKTVPVPVKKPVKSIPQNTSYVPSSRAKEYFKEYEQRSKMKEIMQLDIWARAEKQMKELEEQRKRKAEMSPQLPLSSETITSRETAEQKLDLVRLPLHRHLLTGECIVCKVLCGEEKVPMTEDDDSTSS